MRKRLQAGVVAAVLIALASASSWAAPDGARGPNPKAPGQVKKAPEIDVGAAGGAIASLVGVLLLAAERRRRS